MNFIQQNQQDEQNYQEAIKKACEAKEAFDKLTPQNKERFFKDIIGMNIFANIVKGGGY